MSPGDPAVQFPRSGHADMIIVNADDLGRSHSETDAALSCYAKGRITSATAMVFMADSERAADVAKITDLDIGLHLNLSETFTSPRVPVEFRRQHESIVHFLNRGKYALVLYNPFLRKQFQYVYQAQIEEFLRLYGKPPSHIDGHCHMHLCTNMLVDRVIPAGRKVRRSFSFSRDEKGLLNRAYRGLVDGWLQRRYLLTDYFFCLRQCLQAKRLDRVIELSKTANIELMTHPKNVLEYDFLMGNGFERQFNGVKLATYSQL
jgi:predicted glycoside hydrolase/deacetylase ChbG (UPF0249 family)